MKRNDRLAAGFDPDIELPDNDMDPNTFMGYMKFLAIRQNEMTVASIKAATGFTLARSRDLFFINRWIH